MWDLGFESCGLYYKEITIVSENYNVFICLNRRLIILRLRVQVLPRDTSGLYHKPMTIVNDDARVVNKLEASLTDNARVVIYDRHMFIVQATGVRIMK